MQIMFYFGNGLGTTHGSSFKTYFSTPPRMMRFKQTGHFVTQCRRPSSVADAFHVSCANGFRFTSHLDNLRFCSSDWLHVSIHGTSFCFLLSKLSKL